MEFCKSKNNVVLYKKFPHLPLRDFSKKFELKLIPFVEHLDEFVIDGQISGDGSWLQLANGYTYEYDKRSTYVHRILTGPIMCWKWMTSVNNNGEVHAHCVYENMTVKELQYVLPISDIKKVLFHSLANGKIKLVALNDDALWWCCVGDRKVSKIPNPYSPIITIFNHHQYGICILYHENDKYVCRQVTRDYTGKIILVQQSSSLHVELVDLPSMPMKSARNV